MPEPVVGFCEVAEGVRLAYGTLGEGPPLVLVPGWLTHVTELWSHPAAASALRKLGDGHRFLWYDRLGLGLSDPPTEAVTGVDELRAVLDACEIERADLIGYSMGGPEAVRFAVAHPERVRHLVLYSTWVRGLDVADEETVTALAALVRSGWSLASVTMASIFLPDAPQDDVRWFSRFQRRAAPAEVAAGLLERLRHDDISGLAPSLRVPTTVISARDDRVVSPTHARELARLVPGARLVLVDGRTHDPFIRDAGDVVEAILAAVEGRPMATPAAGEPPDRTVTASLTRRELDVIAAVVGGSSNKAIASELGVGVATVERHLTNLYRKLGATGRADAAVRAVRQGIVRENP